ncbi:Retrovirus-related Pol polyprotein [Larimichthys crocea]|uniref:Retrovirus-related Pol polyprotein n=1 Tax=Larimichthys crocea TaxID=215358 RepID=A0A6G0I8C7_LARCR|nr:Retrovirus-related Pol polyprotein [Larimichthys crocea]
MLGTLENQDKSHWKDFVKPLAHAYNCTRIEVTGFTPYELMFGRQPRLLVDLAFGLPVKEEQQKSHSQYVKNLKSHLEESYKIATRSAARVAEKNKTRFDKRVTPSALDVGDRVLVRNQRELTWLYSQGKEVELSSGGLWPNLISGLAPPYPSELLHSYTPSVLSGGWSNNPSASQFQAIFRHLMVQWGVSPSTSGNVAAQDETVSMSAFEMSSPAAEDSRNTVLN